MTEAASGLPSTSLHTMSCAAEKDERHATCSGVIPTLSCNISKN